MILYSSWRTILVVSAVLPALFLLVRTWRLDRLEKEGSRILVTADNGAIILETDGKRTGAAYYRDLLK